MNSAVCAPIRAALSRISGYQPSPLRGNRLPPPAASQVYELTDWGLELKPVLQRLGRWGARSPSLPRGAAISVATFITALGTMFSPQEAQGLAASLELRLGEDRFHARIEGGQFEIARGGAASPDAILEGDHAALAALIFGNRPLEEALREGNVKLTGNRQAVERFLRLFPLPEPAPPAALAG